MKAVFVDQDDKEQTAELHGASYRPPTCAKQSLDSDHPSGDMFGTTANIALADGTPLAHISRKLITVTDIVADKQTVSEMWKGALLAPADADDQSLSTMSLSLPVST